MDLRDLLYFEAIARLGSLGRAAEELGRTKPALSKSIRRLEEQVRGPLFERTGRRLVLTPPGQTLLAHTLQVRIAMDDALRHVTDEVTGRRGHIRIGLGTSIVEFLLPPMAQWLAAQPDGVRLDIRSGLNDALRQQLMDDQLDGIVTTAQADDGGPFLREDWVTDDMVVVAREGHPLAREGVVEMAEMTECGWVLTGRTVASRQWLDLAFTARGMAPPRVRAEVGSVQFLPAFIGATDMLSFMPRRNLGTGRLGARLRELRNDATTLRRSMSFLFRRNGYVSPALLHLAQALRLSLQECPGDDR